MPKNKGFCAGVGLTAVGVAMAVQVEGCRGREDDGPSPRAPVDVQAKTAGDILIFPDELRVQDATVNDFVVRAMNTCGAGDYEPFRLLWSAREEPLPKDQFDEGWQAVQLIRIAGLRKAVVAGAAEEPGSSPAGEIVYIVLAEVQLDPEHPAGKRQPQREVVLMLVRENDKWRMAQAPKPMRDWIRQQAGAGEALSPDAAQENAGRAKPPRGDES